MHLFALPLNITSALMQISASLSHGIAGCFLMITASQLVFSIGCGAQDLGTPGQFGLASGTVAGALVDPQYSIAVCESRVTSAPKDYELKSGDNLMVSDFVSRFSSNEVKYLHVLQPVKGEFDRIVVYHEVAGFSKRTQFLPSPNTKWIVIFKNSPASSPPIVWKDNDGRVRRQMPVLEIADKVVGVATYGDTPQSTNQVDDLKALAAIAGKKPDLAALKMRLKTPLGREVAGLLEKALSVQK